MHGILWSDFVADKLRSSKDRLMSEYNVTIFCIKNQFSTLGTFKMTIKESQEQTI